MCIRCLGGCVSRVCFQYGGSEGPNRGRTKKMSQTNRSSYNRLYSHAESLLFITQLSQTFLCRICVLMIAIEGVCVFTLSLFGSRSLCVNRYIQPGLSLHCNGSHLKRKPTTPHSAHSHYKARYSSERERETVEVIPGAAELDLCIHVRQSENRHRVCSDSPAFLFQLGAYRRQWAAICSMQWFGVSRTDRKLQSFTESGVREQGKESVYVCVCEREKGIKQL